MRRRTLLASAAASLALPAVARAQRPRVLRVVPQADVAALDPVWTTSYQTRDHGFLVFDTLFGTDAAFQARPQMAEGARTEDDGRSWRIVLREGLRFHDGTQVLARDCAASLRRWGARDAFGQALMAATDEIAAPDDRTLTIRLKAPFPLLPDALAKTPPSMCPIMPERLARTDPFTQVTEMVGSGPYRFKADERVPGARVVYERFDGYVPRPDGAASGTAGPKIAHFDRVEWVLIPDGGTAASALQRGEVDWWLTPDSDLLPVLQRDRALRTEIVDRTGLIATMRFNQLQPPFDNPAIRAAILGAVSQADYMTGIVGADPANWRDGVGYFCPDTPLASSAGMQALTGRRDLDAARRALEKAGYKGEKVVLLMGTDIASVRILAEITADMMRRLGINLDAEAMDWATVVQRRVKQDPVDKGGWSVFQTSWSGRDMINPAGHVFLRGNGKAAAPGWPASAQIERLRDAWFRAADLDAQKRLADAIQLAAFRDVPYIPLGQYFVPTSYRADLTGVLPGNPVFWNVRRG